MNALEINDLTKRFPGFALGPLDLVLPCGCIMGLIGENGAGKSTTMKLILDILHKDSGSITILGSDNQADTRLTKEEIGVVLDEVGLPDCLRLSQVSKIMRHTYENWDDEAFAALAGRLSLPEDTAFKDYSRGMTMKLGIAIAMSHGSKLLLLDEATAGLDPVVRDDVVEMLSEFTRDETHAILISSHITSDLEKLCDYVAFLHHGKLLLCEEKDRLLEEYGLLHCTKEQLADLPEEAVRYKHVSPYGVEVMARRDAIPATFSMSPVSMEELFVFMVKEEEA